MWGFISNLSLCASEGTYPVRQRKISKSNREAPEPRDIKEFLAQEKGLSEIAMRKRAAVFFFVVYGMALAATFAIYFLHGFHAWGFSIELELLKWLGGVTIGELGGLALAVYGFLFRS